MKLNTKKVDVSDGYWFLLLGIGGTVLPCAYWAVVTILLATTMFVLLLVELWCS